MKKIHNLSNEFDAGSVFVLSPTFHDFFLKTCGPGTNFSFCERNIKSFPDYSKNIEQIQKFLLKEKDNPSNYNKFSAHSGTWPLYLRFNNIFKSSPYNFIDYQDKLVSNHIFPMDYYNKDDPFHYSPKGNKFLANIIFQHIESSLVKNSK